MKLEKAIELNKEARLSLIKGKFPDHADAVQLGIEAMKTLKYMRNAEHPVPPALLPGETED